MADSRRKGAAFERQIATALRDELGIKFKRNLNQYQERNLGDLTPDDDAFPFLIECKSYASGTDCRPGWETQAHKAALGTGLYPVVIYKFNNHPVKCRVPLAAIAHANGSPDILDGTADVYLPTLAMLAREIMARKSEQMPGSGH